MLLSSLDLSAAFDIVNISLPLKRLKKIGLPTDEIGLIEVWLRNRLYCVLVDGFNFRIYNLLLVAVQGSILGLVLCTMLISPLFEIESLCRQQMCT